MGFSKFLNQQYDSTMADGKKTFKNLIKPMVALFRKNKKDKTKNQENKKKIDEVPKNGEIDEKNNIKNNKDTRNSQDENEKHETRDPYTTSLLKKLEKLEIDKNKRLEGLSNLEDNDSICDPNETLDELEDKFNQVDENDPTSDSNLNKVDDTPKLQETQDAYESDNNEELCENFSELIIQKKEEVEDDDEELKKFSIKVIKDDKACRNDSQSSQDSGFAEKCSLLASDDENEGKEEVKQKRIQIAYLKRAPIRNRTAIKDASASAQPYHCEINLYPQIHSGGQVFVKNQQATPLIHHQNFNPSIQLENVTPSFQQLNLNEQSIDLENYISKILSQEEINMCRNIVQNDLFPTQFNPESNYPDRVPDLDSTPRLDALNENVSKDFLTPPSSVTMYSPTCGNIGSPASLRLIESPLSSLNDENEKYRDIPQIDISSPVDPLNSENSSPIHFMNSSNYTENSSPIGPLNPYKYSENSSPINSLNSSNHSENSSSIGPLNSYKYTENSSPINSLNLSNYTENSSPIGLLNSYKYTENSSPINSLNSSNHTENSSPIGPLNSYKYTENSSPINSLNSSNCTENSSPIGPLESSPVESKKPAPKKTMKFYKDRQTELQNKFAKMECCQSNLKSCKEIFKEILLGLPAEDRKKLCCSVAKLELDSTLSVLQRTLLALGRDEAEAVNMALLSLICEKVLSERKTLFVDEDFGLELLKMSVFFCYKRPVITRYLVQCIRVVTRSPDYQQVKRETVFTEVDSRGDNLVIACVRAGDQYANALRELVRAGTHDVPLFNVDHVNTDGYTALHVCCAAHSASTPRAHALHVLVKHARADRYIKDRKGAETPLHLAVNSANCDLDLVLLYFNERSERSSWFALAHTENNGGHSPLGYAKKAMIKRKNYPSDIRDFLERCRKLPARPRHANRDTNVNRTNSL